MDLREVSAGRPRRHPWEVARAGFFLRVLADAGALEAPRAVLDVGAGDGYLGRELLDVMPKGSEIVCLDPGYRDEDLRAFADPPRAGLSFVRAAPPRRFDVLLLLDVIEHVADDGAFVGELVARHLAPGGLALVSVPAWPFLYGAHDRALAHERRYRPEDCRALLAGAGLAIVRAGGLFHALLAPRLLALARERVAAWLGRASAPPPNLGAWRRGPLVTAALGGALALDNALSRALARRGLALPGLSTWALCRARQGGAS